MLDLVFINDQAPALNADNMNRIVNEINKTDAKANDLQSEIATLVIEKGGSIVQANPEEIPPEAEELNRLRINDKVYNISTTSLNERITELDEKIDTEVSQLEDSIDSKVTQLTFETGIDIGDWEAVIDPDEPVTYERYMNYHDAVAKLSQQIDIMGNRTDALKTSLNALENYETNTDVVVGTYKDGSFTGTLKKKVLKLSNISNNHQINFDNGQSILKIEGRAIASNGFVLPLGFNDETGSTFNVYVNTTSDKLQIKFAIGSSGATAQSVILIIYYVA